METVGKKSVHGFHALWLRTPTTSAQILRRIPESHTRENPVAPDRPLENKTITIVAVPVD
jgi:hypothetical protein